MASVETIQVMRDGIEVTINKCDLHLEMPAKESSKKSAKKEFKKTK